jgi:hypothetical protein
VAVAEEAWHAARLIPTSGISGVEEQERRATSALLAVMIAVREFGRTITAAIGAPAGIVEAYIEVPFMLGERRLYPDGLIRVSRGQRSWTALVEVKTGTNKLEAEQLEAYLDIARENGFNTVLTVSNEIPAMPGSHPTTVDKRKIRKVELHHLSWTRILTEAVVQKEHRGVADPDQAWILGELIRYLEHPRSGALEFEDMGPSWVTVREAVTSGTLRSGDKAAIEVAGRWESLVAYLALRLGRRLGTEVQPALTRAERAAPQSRIQASVAGLAKTGQMSGGIRVPDTVGPLQLTADLRAGRLFAAVDIEAPREGRAQTRVTWLVRQLKDSPESVRIDAFVANSRGSSTSELLSTVRDNPAVLISDPKRELRMFRVTLSAAMGSKRGQGRGSFVGSAIELVDEFYGTVMQSLKPWAARPPKLREADPEPAEIAADEGVVPALVSTALSSQDGLAEESPSPDDATTAGLEEPGRDAAPSTHEAETGSSGAPQMDARLSSTTAS